MATQLDRHEAIAWYKAVVEKPLKSGNKAAYHPCCNTYSTRDAKKEIRESHTQGVQ